VVFIATIFGAMAEGMTMQYDNLLCPMFYYCLVLALHNFFLDISY